MASIDADQVPYDIKTMKQRLAESLGSQRFNAIWMACFAGTAMLLATIGVYGVMSWSVTLRKRDIGLRSSLGAQPKEIVRMLVGKALAMAISGCAVGLAGAIGLSRFLAGLLVNVNTGEPNHIRLMRDSAHGGGRCRLHRPELAREALGPGRVAAA